MPHMLPSEHPFTASGMGRDSVIGMADGLTVPFALAAGLSGATRVVVIAGIAEISARAIAVSLGGYLPALVVFGFFKARFAGSTPVRGALQTLVVGGLAATAAFLIARAIS
jgi:VIT1/CCC1 family predicted Fe2+/Mn2+ transporter